MALKAKRKNQRSEERKSGKEKEEEEGVRRSKEKRVNEVRLTTTSSRDNAHATGRCTPRVFVLADSTFYDRFLAVFLRTFSYAYGGKLVTT